MTQHILSRITRKENRGITLRREAIIRSARSSTRIEGNRLSLTERQMQIVEFINQNGKITVGDVSRMFKITRQASLKEISKLVELEVVKLMGKGRGAHYVLS